MAHHLGTIVHLAIGIWQRHAGVALSQGSTERRRRKRQRDQQSHDGAKQEQFRTL